MRALGESIRGKALGEGVWGGHWGRAVSSCFIYHCTLRYFYILKIFSNHSS